MAFDNHLSTGLRQLPVSQSIQGTLAQPETSSSISTMFGPHHDLNVYTTHSYELRYLAHVGKQC